MNRIENNMHEVELKTDFVPFEERHEKGEEFVFNQWLFRFKDNRGLSVICHTSKKDGCIKSYGNPSKPFEAVLIRFDEDSDDFFLSEEPKGFLAEEDVNKLLKKLEGEQK